MGGTGVNGLIVNSEYNVPAVCSRNKMMTTEGNKTGALSFVMIILPTDDAPKLQKKGIKIF